MRFRNTTVSIAILALLAAGAGLVVSGRQLEAGSSGVHLILALESTGAVLKEWTVSAFSKLPKAEYKSEELTRMVQAAVIDCGADPNQLQISLTQGKRFVIARAKWQGEGIRISTVAQTLEAYHGGAKESFLSVQVEKAGDINQLSNLQQKIRNLMRKAGGECTVYTCVYGWLDGKLEKDFLAEKVKQAFKAVNAEQGDGVSYPGFISYSGYGQHLGATVKAGNKLINMNIAMRYNEVDDRTYVWVGSPLITQEY